MNTCATRIRAFSLIELVVVVVIIGVLAALAIPRFSQAASNTAEDELKSSLTVLRTAIELYYDDHGVYPGKTAAGDAPAGSAEAFMRQLTQYTDESGNASPVPAEAFRFGPYLRDGMPPCPMCIPTPSRLVKVVRGDESPACDTSAVEVGWVYNPDTGYIAANVPGVGAGGVRYDAY